MVNASQMFPFNISYYYKVLTQGCLQENFYNSHELFIEKLWRV